MDDLSGTPATDYYVEVFEDTVFSPGHSFGWNEPANTAQNHYVNLNSPVKREWYIKFHKFNPYLGHLEVVKTVRICVIPKIENVEVEVPEICSGNFTPPADGNFHFKIKTTPAIDAVMFHQDLVYNGYYTPGPGCDQVEAFQIGIDPKVVTYTSFGSQADVYDVRSVYSATNTSLLLPPDNSVKASRWGTYPGLPGLMNDFYANLNTPSGGNGFDLQSYINGVNVGKSVKIRVHITDGVLLDKYIDAPLIIHAPITTTGGTSATNFAGGYDTTRYTLPAGSTQVWSSTSDPVFAQYGNSTAPSVLRIRDSLVIPAGTTLTIKDRRVEFGPNGKLIIEAGKNGRDGGYLKLDNATLSAYHACGNDNLMWQGVQVRGDITKRQIVGRYPPAAEWQGTLEMVNGSEISYARIGVQNWNGAAANTTGGVIRALDSRFTNNSNAVKFMPFAGQNDPDNPQYAAPYAADFSNCTFDVNKTLTQPFTNHMLGLQVRGVRVLGCRFYNSAGGYALTTGISGVDFGVGVDWYQANRRSAPVYSEFKDMRYGASFSSLSVPNPPRVQHSQFSGLQTGIASTGVQLPVFTDNSFLVKPYQTITKAYGITVSTGSHYLITRNKFVGNGGSNVQVAGVVIKDAGSVANNVFVNTYDGLYTGNLSNNLNQGSNGATNTGLQFLCNSYAANRYAEAARGSNPTQHGMNKSQGSAARSAGNTFNSNATDIYNPANEVVPVTYWLTSCANCIPVNNVGSVTSATASGASDCVFSTGIGPLGGIEGYHDPRTSGGPFAGLRITHNAGFAFSDSLGRMNRDSVNYWLAQMQSPYADLLKVDMLLADGNAEAANNAYNAIAGTYTMPGLEATEFSAWGRQLMDIRLQLARDGKALTDLTAAQVQTLDAIATGAKMWAKERAQAWLGVYDGRRYEHDFLFPEENGGPQQRRTNATAVRTYNVYPNPVSDYLSVAYINTAEKGAVMQVTDVLGRVISTSMLEGKSGNILIDMRSLQSGIYLYRVLENGNAVQQGKVTKQ